MSDNRGRYAWGVTILSVLGLGCALLIVLGEAFGGPDQRWYWQLGSAALGAILVIYGLILLLLRKLGMIGPRRAER
jgi:hypothetical protein